MKDIKFLALFLLCMLFFPFVVSGQNVEVGDYFEIIPDAVTYEIPSVLTGYESNQIIKPKELNLWRTISKNNDGTIDLVSEYVSSDKVYFRGIRGYANFVGAMQTIAQSYKKEGYTLGMRMMGYDGQTLTIEDTSRFDGTNNHYPSMNPTLNPTSGTGYENSGGVLGDTYYLKDYLLVKDVYGNIAAQKVDTTTSTAYWLTSRKYDYKFSGEFTFNVRMTTMGYIFDDPLRSCDDGNWKNFSVGYSIRPIITVIPDDFNSGNGTKSNPYKLNELSKSNIIIDNDDLKGSIIDLDNTVAVEENSKVVFYIEPKEGYLLKEVKIIDSNNQEINYVIDGNKYTFNMPNTNVTISTDYEKVKNSVNIEIVNETKDLNVKIDDLTQVEFGEEVKFHVNPIKGYKLNRIRIIDENSNEIEYTRNTIENEYIFTMPASSVTIIPSYERVKNAVSIEDNNNTKEFVIEVNDSQAIVYEDIVRFVVKPEEGYEVDYIDIVDEENNKISYNKTNNENEYEFIMPDTNVTIKMIYRKIELIDLANNINDVKDLDNPNTGDKLFVVISLFFAGLGIGVFMYKKMGFRYNI